MPSSSSPPCPQPAAKNPTGRKTQIRTQTDTNTYNFNFISCLQFTNARELVGQHSTITSHTNTQMKHYKTQILERRAAQIHLFSICQRQRAGWGALGRGHRQPIHRQILIGIVTDTTLLLPSVQDRLQVCCITLTECRPSSLLHSSLLLLLPQSGVVTSQKRGRPPDHCQLSILQFLVLPTLYFPHYSL